MLIFNVCLRHKCCVHFTTALDGDAFFYQQLLLKLPFRQASQNGMISPDNVSCTFKEECFLRGILDAQDEFDVNFQEMKHRSFDPLHIAMIAKQIFYAQLSDRNTLDQNWLS